MLTAYQGDAGEAAVKGNARYAAQQLSQRSTVLADAVNKGQLKIVASYFDIHSGTVTLL